MIPNKKKVLVVERMAPAAWKVLNERPDVEAVEFANFMPPAEFNALLKQHAPVHGIALGAMTFGRDEVASAGGMQVLGRVGVGYDSVDVAALSDGKVALMTTGIANSPSVAECALFMMMALAKRSVELDTLVKTGRWKERMIHTPFDLLGKTAIVIGFGRIGSRLVKRLVALEMNVLVYDPFKTDDEIAAVGAHRIADLDKALPDADFISVNCPRAPDTLNMFDARRLALLKPTAYFVNTARGGIVDEAALYERLSTGKLAGAGLDVFAQEPPSNDHPLLKLPNVITAPHVAGVTKEALERMGVQTMHNILSLLDGVPIRENVINPEVLG